MGTISETEHGGRSFCGLNTNREWAYTERNLEGSMAPARGFVIKKQERGIRRKTPCSGWPMDSRWLKEKFTGELAGLYITQSYLSSHLLNFCLGKPGNPEATREVKAGAELSRLPTTDSTTLQGRSDIQEFENVLTKEKTSQVEVL